MAKTIAQDIATYQAIPAAQRTAKQSAALATDVATQARQSASPMVATGSKPAPSANAQQGTPIAHVNVAASIAKLSGTAQGYTPGAGGVQLIGPTPPSGSAYGVVSLPAGAKLPWDVVAAVPGYTPSASSGLVSGAAPGYQPGPGALQLYGPQPPAGSAYGVIAYPGSASGGGGGWGWPGRAARAV